MDIHAKALRCVPRPFWVRTVCVVFGLMVLTAGTTATIAKPSATLESAAPITVLFLGDSLTEGLNLPRGQAFPEVIGRLLETKGRPGVKIINGGISGSTSASGPGRLKWHLKSPDKAKILVLELGANDGLRGLDPQQLEKNLSTTIALAKDHQMAVLLCGMRLPPNYGQAYADQFASVFPRVAAASKASLIPFLLDGVAGNPALNLADGLHPNAEGYKIVAATVLKYLEPLL